MLIKNILSLIIICYNFGFFKAHQGDDHICEMRYLESINGLVYTAQTTAGPFPATLNDYVNSTDLLAAGKAGQPGLTADRDSVINGVKLTLNLKFYNVDSNQNATPLTNAEIYIWHCDAAGAYSAISSEGTSGMKWLRAVQTVDSNGFVKFNTIIPGWYNGRIVHFHIRVHLKSASQSSYVMTSQLFVPETIVSSIRSITPYSSNKQILISKSEDGIYKGISASLQDQMFIPITGDSKNGYSSTYNIGILSSGNGNSIKGENLCLSWLMLVIFAIFI